MGNYFVIGGKRICFTPANFQRMFIDQPYHFPRRNGNVHTIGDEKYPDVSVDIYFLVGVEGTPPNNGDILQ